MFVSFAKPANHPPRIVDDSLDKVVPQHSCGVLQNPDVCRDLDFVILDRWSGLARCRVGRIQLSKVYKSGETPIAFFGNETVVGVCDRESGRMPMSSPMLVIETYGWRCGWWGR